MRQSFIMESTEKLDDHYKIVEEIGKGAYGIVYTAKHKETGDIRAVKVVKKKDEKSKNETSILKELVFS